MKTEALGAPTIERLNIRCPGCEAPTVEQFCEFQDAPVNVGKSEPSVKAAQAAPRGEIRLCYCGNCGLVHNAAFDPSRIGFEPGYEVALHHSTTFRTFIENLAKRLIDRYDLCGKRVLDIGCGGGFFLEKLCEFGGVEGAGVDPTVPREGDYSHGDGSLKLVRDFWTREHAGLIGDFITCQSMFEDVPRPLEFLRDLRRMIGDRETPLYFEVFNGYRTFANEETWSIHYEQCNLFSLDCLQRIFERAGFEVTEAGACYQGDQYIYVEAIPTRPHLLDTATAEIPEEILRFATTHARNVASWTERLLEWKREGSRVVIWGAGGKCVNFLNTIAASDLIDEVVEINPDRQGTFIPGSGQRIVSPESLVGNSPDRILVMNPLYENEIKAQAAALGLNAEVLIA